MSGIEIAVGDARAEIASVGDAVTPSGTFPHYNPRDLLDATAAALLAINTPQAIKWAHGIYEMTANS